MEDLLEQNNNNYYSYDSLFMKLNEELFFEEKGTSYATSNQYNYENNNPLLNELSNPFLCSHNENEDYEVDNENYYLNKKTNRDENIKYENKTSSKDKNNNIFIIKKNLNEKEEIKNIKDKKIKDNINLKDNRNKISKLYNFGRKNKESGETGKHNKSCEDNIINKIKTNFFSDYIRNIIKENSINKDIDLKKLRTKEFMADLSKQNNERLFNMKIKDILCEQPISTKYSTFDNFENKLIIEKIYEEKKEINVIKILELTFEELLIIYRSKLKDPKDMEKLEEIKGKIEGLDLLSNENKYNDFAYLINKLEKNHEEEYIEKIKILCLGYENWFNERIGRKYD